MCGGLELLKQAEKHADRSVELSDNSNYEAQGKALIVLAGNNSTPSELHQQNVSTVSYHAFPVDAARQFFRVSQVGDLDTAG